MTYGVGNPDHCFEQSQKYGGVKLSDNYITNTDMNFFFL